MSILLLFLFSDFIDHLMKHHIVIHVILCMQNAWIQIDRAHGVCGNSDFY